MPSVFLASSVPGYVALVLTSIVVSGIIAVAIHHSMVKYNRDADGKPRIDSNGAWLFAGIVMIPFAVVFWAILLAVVGPMIGL